MVYTFTNKVGTVRTYHDRGDFIRAFENQARIDRLQELNRDIVYEEMQYETVADIIAETGIVAELELNQEDR